MVLEPEIILKAKERARRAGQKGLLAPVHTSMHYHFQPSATKRERTETKKRNISEKQQRNRNTMRVSAKTMSAAI